MWQQVFLSSRLLQVTETGECSRYIALYMQTGTYHSCYNEKMMEIKLDISLPHYKLFYLLVLIK